MPISVLTSQPARSSSAASIVSWHSTSPPIGGRPGSTGSCAWVLNGARRRMALWPQNVPRRCCQRSWPATVSGVFRRAANCWMRPNRVVAPTG